MAQNSLIQVRVDDSVKQQADSLFSALGMDTPTAIRLFLKQAIMRHGIPFSVTVDEDFYNDYNLKLMEEAAKRIESGQNLIVKTFEELAVMADE